MGALASSAGTALAPFTGGASLALTAAGAGLGAIGAAQSSSAQAANAQYQAQVARNNQIVAEQNAGAAIQTGEARSTARSLAGAATMGRIKTSQAANNIDVNSGTAVDVRSSQSEMNALDAATEEHNAQLQAYGYRTQGVNYGAEATLATAQASQALAAGGIGVASSLIGGAGQLSNKFLWMQQNAGGPVGGTGGLY